MVSLHRTCLKRGYLWKCSWSSSDRSLIFNRQGGKLCCSFSSEATLCESLSPSPFHHLSFPRRRLRPAAERSVKTLRSITCLINHKPDLRRCDSRVEGDLRTGTFQFPLKRGEHEDNGKQKQFGVSDKKLRVWCEDKLLVSDYFNLND